jgi:ABC-type sugar transport system ATPase subunit
MRTQIKRLHMKFRATSVYVSHDQTEAMTLADRIVALRNGVIEQIGTPEELYARPANRFVAGFIGSPKMNFLKGQIVLKTAGRSPFPRAPSSYGCRSPSGTPAAQVKEPSLAFARSTSPIDGRSMAGMDGCPSI